MNISSHSKHKCLCLVSQELSSEQRTQLEIIDGRITRYKQDIVELTSIYSQKKYEIIKEWSEDLERKYTILEKPLDTICRDITDELNALGASDGAIDYVYERLPDRFKRNYTKSDNILNIFGKELEKQKAGKPAFNKTPADCTDQELYDKTDELYKEYRKYRKFGEDERGLDFSKPKQGPKITTDKPPEDQQGPSSFSEAIKLSAREFHSIGDNLEEISNKAEVYKPLDPEREAEMSKAWNEDINNGILKVFRRFFIPAKDNKWSIGWKRWANVITDRIKQSKHAAGKMNEDYVTDPKTGEVMRDEKGKPVKEDITRERVGDAEAPVYKYSGQFIAMNRGLQWMKKEVEEAKPEE